MASGRTHNKLRSPRHAVAVAALTVGLALAAGPATARAANLVATPNPAQANASEVWLSGCGYAAGKQVSITFYGPLGVGFFYLNTDPNGCIVPYSVWPNTVGGYEIEARQSGKGKKQTLMADCYLDVN